MLNVKQSAQFLGVNRSSFCTYVVPLIFHLRSSTLHKQEWVYKEEDLLRIKPFLKKYGCGRMAARAIKKFLDEESK